MLLGEKSAFMKGVETLETYERRTRLSERLVEAVNQNRAEQSFEHAFDPIWNQ